MLSTGSCSLGSASPERATRRVAAGYLSASSISRMCASRRPIPVSRGASGTLIVSADPSSSTNNSQPFPSIRSPAGPRARTVTELPLREQEMAIAPCVTTAVTRKNPVSRLRVFMACLRDDRASGSARGQRVPGAVETASVRLARGRISGEEVKGVPLIRGLPLPVAPREDAEVGDGQGAGHQRLIDDEKRKIGEALG